MEAAAAAAAATATTSVAVVQQIGTEQKMTMMTYDAKTNQWNSNYIPVNTTTTTTTTNNNNNNSQQDSIVSSYSTIKQTSIQERIDSLNLSVLHLDNLKQAVSKFMPQQTTTPVPVPPPPPPPPPPPSSSFQLESVVHKKDTPLSPQIRY